MSSPSLKKSEKNPRRGDSTILNLELKSGYPPGKYARFWNVPNVFSHTFLSNGYRVKEVKCIKVLVSTSSNGIILANKESMSNLTGTM